jgi:hypothetical protein
MMLDDPRRALFEMYPAEEADAERSSETGVADTMRAAGC